MEVSRQDVCFMNSQKGAFLLKKSCRVCFNEKCWRVRSEDFLQKDLLNNEYCPDWKQPPRMCRTCFLFPSNPEIDDCAYRRGKILWPYVEPYFCDQWKFSRRDWIERGRHVSVVKGEGAEA